MLRRCWRPLWRSVSSSPRFHGYTSPGRPTQRSDEPLEALEGAEGSDLPTTAWRSLKRSRRLAVHGAMQWARACLGLAVSGILAQDTLAKKEL